jgi:hypothetical protein
MHLPASLASGSFTANFNVMTAAGIACVRPHPPISFFVAGRPTTWGAADLGGRFETETIA